LKKRRAWTSGARTSRRHKIDCTALAKSQPKSGAIIAPARGRAEPPLDIASSFAGNSPRTTPAGTKQAPRAPQAPAGGEDKARAKPEGAGDPAGEGLGRGEPAKGRAARYRRESTSGTQQGKRRSGGKPQERSEACRKTEPRTCG